MTASQIPSNVVDVARGIAREVAAAHAEDVDRRARFPHETIDALRSEGLLGALVPVEMGGLGHDLPTAAAVVRQLARACASSAMVLAMHHIKVASVVRHGKTPALEDFVRRIAKEQLLLASATTEIGIGGNTRNSTCYVERDGDDFTLRKTAPVISYGQYADAILVTARHDIDSAPTDQVLVVCESDAVNLEPISGWDTLGFRGTCSLGFQLVAQGPQSLVCADSFADISAQTMLPTSHLLWSSLWLGIADEACDRARRFVQKAARRDLGGVPPGAPRLAELLAVRQQMEGAVTLMMRRYGEIGDDPDETSAAEFMVGINTLKVSASTTVVEIVNKAMLICGIAGYREDSDISLGRLLRDAHGAAVMVNNDRIIGNTAQLVLAMRSGSSA